jgi:signal transduction histidine kinase
MHWMSGIRGQVYRRTGTGHLRKVRPGNKESAIPGVGLGLAICQAIIDVHGGTISARTARKGARFCVTLPLDTRQNLMNYQRFVIGNADC